MYDVKNTVDEKKLEVEITSFIRNAGVPLHLKGYAYLRTAIFLVLTDYENFDCVTKVLYPQIAKIYKTTPSRVERAIRHAIEISWENGPSQNIFELFDNGRQFYSRRPTNSEFIALAADNIRLNTLR